MNPKILIVEDEMIVGEATQAMLADMGYLVAGIATAQPEALQLIDAARPDLVLMDINLGPDQEGIDAAEIIRGHYGLPVIYVTAYTDETTLSRAKVTQPFGYVVKPFEKRDLQVAIEIALHNHRMEQRLKKSEQALWESETLLNASGRMAKVGGWELDAATMEVRWTEETCRIHEVPLGHKPSLAEAINYYIPEDREKISNAVHRALNLGEPFDVQLRVTTATGKNLWVHAIGQPQVLDGKTVRLLGAFQDITDRKQSEDAYLFLAQCGCTTAGEDFFQSLAAYLGQKLGVDYVCIDRLEEGNLSARTESIYFDGKFQSNVTYTLKDTPCGAVVEKTVCCFPSGVRHLFPKDQVLQDMMAEFYAGIILWGYNGQPIGLIAIIGRQAMANPERAKSLLRLVAGRAAGELERKQAESALQQKIQALERFNALTVDRELRMIELKKEVNALLEKAGEPDKYRIVK